MLLRFKQGRPDYTREIDHVTSIKLKLSDNYTLRVEHDAKHRETLVLLDTEVPNAEGPHPTKTVTDCLWSVLHAGE